MSELSSAISDALDTRDMVPAFTSVKQLVCNELNRVDPKVEIRRTDYFNHSFVPDIILKWKDGVEREVFLRFIDPALLAEDLDRIGIEGPIVFDIGDHSRTGTSHSNIESPGKILGRFENVMMTDTEATSEIRPERSANVIMNMVTSNVLKSGRGEYGQGTTRELFTTAQSGFDGVVGLDPGKVANAMAILNQRFDPDFEHRVERLLQLLWWANGGESAVFPITSLDDLSLNAADTQDFLRSVLIGEYEINIDSFWSRLADRMSFDLLVGAGPINGSYNLERLMKELTSRLKLSHAAMDSIARPFPPDDVWHWSIFERFLVFSGGDWKCQFTPQGNRFSQRHEEGVPVTLGEAKVRSGGIRIEGAELHESSRLVKLTRLESDAAMDDVDSLNFLTDGFNDSDQVQKVVVRVGESEIVADYDRMLLSAEPDSTVRTMANLAFKLLATVSTSELASLDMTLNPVS